MVHTGSRFTGLRAIACAIALSVALTSGSCMSTQTENGARPLVVAHRGGAGLAPENTIAAFAGGLEYRPDAVELDVHLSRDGHLAVIHDPVLIRTTNEPGTVEDYDMAALQEMNAAARYFGKPVGRQPIPTLDEVLELVRGRAGIQVEIKVRENGSRYAGIEEIVLAALREHGMTDEAVVISFDFPSLGTIRQLEPGIRTGALIGTRYMEEHGTAGPEAIAREIRALGVTHVGVDRRRLTPELLAAFHAEGLLVGVWTVNDPREIRQFAEMGVDFLTSDRPDVAREVIGG